MIKEETRQGVNSHFYGVQTLKSTKRKFTDMSNMFVDRYNVFCPQETLCISSIYGCGLLKTSG